MVIEWPAPYTARNTGLLTYYHGGRRGIVLSPAGPGTWNQSALAASAKKSAGLWLFECSVGKFSDDFLVIAVGDGDALPPLGTWIHTPSNDYVGLYLADGKLWRNNVAISAAYAGHGIVSGATRVFSLVVAPATRKCWVMADGVFLFDPAGDPAAGSNEAFTVGGAFGLEPIVSMYRYNVGHLVVHGPDEIQFPVAGAVPYGFEAATITFASGAITDAAGNAVTESGVIASVCDRATGVQIATTTANVSGGAATLNITADVTNGQTVVVHFHNTSGTFKAGGFLNTVVV